MDEGRIGKFVIGHETVKGISLLAASQGEPKSHGTIWSLQTIKLLLSPLFSTPPSAFLPFSFLKEIIADLLHSPPQGREGKSASCEQIPALSNKLMK